MMPLAVLMMFLELHVMDRLIVEREESSSRKGPAQFLPLVRATAAVAK
jgi:hypothetical protein